MSGVWSREATKATVMNIIELLLITKRCGDEGLCIRNLLLLEERTKVPPCYFHIPSTRTTLMKNDFVCHQGVRVATNRAHHLKAINNTPPQVDTSQYRNEGVHARTPGERMERNLPSLLALLRLFVVLPAKSLLSCSSGTFIVSPRLKRLLRGLFHCFVDWSGSPACSREAREGFFAALFSMDEREDGLSVLLM